MTSLLSFTLNRLLLHNFKLMLLRNRQLQSFQISYCYFLATSRSVSYCLISLLPKCLLSLLTKLSSNVYFTLGTVREIWALSKPPRLPIFRMTVFFCLITSGEEPCAMGPQICSECVVIQIQPYAKFGLLKCMSLCRCVAVSLCQIGIDLSRGYLFRPTDQKVASFISFSPVPRQNLLKSCIFDKLI